MVLRFLPDPTILGAIGEARTARLLEERAEALARRGAPEPPRGAPVLLIAVGAENFGLPLSRVAEVLPAEPPCPLPGAPAAMLGLRARAGRLYAVLDLAALTGAVPDAPSPGDAPEGGGHDVLLRPGPGGRRLALRVARALSAAEPQPLPPERAPASPGGAVAFHALLPETGAVLAVLDLDRLLRSYAAPSTPPDAHGA
ncbi:chemotaxis protein CheW [Pararoseomonas indoligenes]|uniref:Chemotaxis protein CheW n=1 Tax=Roseomonas indoligenes TaxID=2820811 RepID=A0A940MX26_9PROT|nr:chemotaxis protein CheW [Pararoseomonas indoligenes]MBP0491330.1 chemotaxis protein CheW [Pararoseomonas indoligenes]